jgi:type IV secretion system protein VirD4
LVARHGPALATECDSVSSRSKRKSRLPVLGAALLVLAAAFGWWENQLNDPHSGVYQFVHHIWPLIQWPIYILIIFALVALVRWRLGRRSASALVSRWSRQAQRHHGLASGWTVLRRSGVPWLRRRATILRPSLRQMSVWQRWRVPVTGLGFRLCRVGLFWAFASVEEITGRFAPPRAGKTGEMLNHILDAPGAVVATSTKPDILDLSMDLRREIGPVYVANPEGLGVGEQAVSTLVWRPEIGCEDTSTAQMRAGTMLAGGADMTGVAAAAFWKSQAVRVLAALLHAAALDGRSMMDVLSWVSDRTGSANEVLRLLSESPSGRAFVDDYQQFVETNSNTGTSITTGIMPALQWLRDRRIAQIALGPVADQFDVERFLDERGTLYLIGEDKEHGGAAPLFAALTAHVHASAKALAGRQPGGRLDPAATFVLDEAPLICPVPLHQWTSDSGGRGIAVHYAAQSRAQLLWKWGPDGGQIIWNNTTAKLIYGGCDDVADLDEFSRLIGNRDEKIATHDKDHQVTGYVTRTVAIMSPSALRSLPEEHVVLLRRGMKPTVGRIRPAWKRSDVKTMRRSQLRVLRQDAAQGRLAAKRQAQQLRRHGGGWRRFVPDRLVGTSAPVSPAPVQFGGSQAHEATTLKVGD